MSTPEQVTVKAGRPSRSLDEEIEATRARLKALEEKRKVEQRLSYERNVKGILALLKHSELDTVPQETWKDKLDQLTKLLNPTIAKNKAEPSKAIDSSRQSPPMSAD
jgi:hypothetical protein